MTCVKVNGTLYPAEIAGRMNDTDWDGRESKAITLTMDYEDAAALFVDGVTWSIVQTYEELEPPLPPEEWDNSDYCVAGDITDHRDGMVTAKMGKYTEVETLMMAM